MWLFDKLKSFFDGCVRAFRSFLADALPITKQAVMGQLSAFAAQTVRSLSFDTVSNEEKRKTAFAQIQEQAKAKGIEIGDSLINLLIELAVQKLKSQLENLNG